MPWGLVIVCVIVFVIITCCTRKKGEGPMCPMGCHGCGYCMRKKAKNVPDESVRPHAFL
ncbi:MAG: hypothetical protein LBT65_05715 [Synergistaceae bacterium]|nr:hypothetical protein [Synergistaceae bacterium]